MAAEAIDALFRHLHTPQGGRPARSASAHGPGRARSRGAVRGHPSGNLAPPRGSSSASTRGWPACAPCSTGARAAPSRTRTASTTSEPLPDGRRTTPHLVRPPPGERAHGAGGSDRWTSCRTASAILVILRTRIERRCASWRGVMRDLDATRGSCASVLGALGAEVARRGRLAEGQGQAPQAAWARCWIAWRGGGGVHRRHRLPGARHQVAGTETESLRRTGRSTWRAGAPGPPGLAGVGVRAAWARRCASWSRPAGKAGPSWWSTAARSSWTRAWSSRSAIHCCTCCATPWPTGIEPPDERVGRGKRRRGASRSRARQEGEFVYLQFEDDGPRASIREQVRQALVRSGKLAPDAPPNGTSGP
jgi:hypothetical protein